MKHDRCALRRWCRKHGYTVANGRCPFLPDDTRVAVILGPRHEWKHLKPELEGAYVQPMHRWRWEFSTYPNSDIYAYKVLS